ncbi:MAG: PH domain-containing protein [Methanobrevibacter sp.]|jgi:membrane protein YdbS with pleckstrin-like domain|nr:PH domain-containing protein [Candidatus Methanovirga australis]
MFEKDDNEFINENILYRAQPSLIFSVKKVFILFIFLWIIFTYSGSLKRSIQKLSDPQQSNLMLTSILRTIHVNETISIIILVLVFILIIWIAWILIKWVKTEYILTDSRIILKRGVVNLKTDYVMYNHIQDIRLSQGIFGRIFSVGNIDIYSGYSKESLKFLNMSTPKKVQKIIFSEMNNDYSFNRSNQFGGDGQFNSNAQFNRDYPGSRHFDDYQKNYNHKYRQNPNYQRTYNNNGQEGFDSRMDNAKMDLNRENNFRNKAKSPKFNNRNKYSVNNINSSTFNSKKSQNKKQIEDNDNLSVIEKHSRKFKK